MKRSILKIGCCAAIVALGIFVDVPSALKSLTESPESLFKLNKIALANPNLEGGGGVFINPAGCRTLFATTCVIFLPDDVQVPRIYVNKTEFY